MNTLYILSFKESESMPTLMTFQAWQLCPYLVVPNYCCSVVWSKVAGTGSVDLYCSQ